MHQNDIFVNNSLHVLKVDRSESSRLQKSLNTTCHRNFTFLHPHMALINIKKIKVASQVLHLMHKGNKNKTAKRQLLHLMRKGNKNKTAKQRKAGQGVALCPCYVHLLQSLQSTRLICTSLHSDIKVCKQPLEM